MAFQAAATLRHGVWSLAAVMAWVAGWSCVACAFFVTADVIGRDMLGVSSAATVELTGYMLACGIAWALAHTTTIRPQAGPLTDVFVGVMPFLLVHLLAVLLLLVFSGIARWLPRVLAWPYKGIFRPC